MTRRRHQITQKRRLGIYEAADWRCFWCSGELATYQQATVDHVIPLVLGGLDLDSNVVASCNPCNNEKGNLGPTEWAQVRPLTHEQIERARLALVEQAEWASALLAQLPLADRSA